MSANLFRNQPLTVSFVASKPFSIVGNKIVLDWTLVVATGTTQVRWYFEFCGPRQDADDPNDAATTWFREVDEVDAGNGVVSMAQVIRSLHVNGGTTGLTVGTHNIHMEFERIAAFGRIQLELITGAGTVIATVDEELGSTPQSSS